MPCGTVPDLDVCGVDRGQQAAAEEAIKVGEDLGVHVQGCAPVVRYLQRVVGVRDFHEGTGSFSLSAPVPESIGRSADQQENGHLAVADLAWGLVWGR